MAKMASAIDLTGDDDIYSDKTASGEEVNVKLRSLDGELDRDILFSEKIGLVSIEVGRASKNVGRNMYPQKGNAWVNSPVMSRHHAMIYIEPRSQDVYVKDLESTHGTKVNGQKLAANKKFKICSGDIITLGSTVRAGPNEFNAKVFEIQCHRNSKSSSPIVLTPSPSTGHVSHGRTYSVPSSISSEDEGDELVEPHDKTLEEEVTIITEARVQHPSNLHVTTPADPPNMLDPLRASQTTQEEGAGNQVDVNATAESPSASECEAPDSLPIQKSKSPDAKARSEPTVYALEYDSDDSESDEESVREDTDHADDLSEAASASAPYSPEMPKSPSYSPSSPSYSPESPKMRATSQEYITGPSRTPVQDNWFEDDEQGFDVYDEFEEAHEGDYPDPSESDSSDSDSDCSKDAAVSECGATEDEQSDHNDDVEEDLSQVRLLIDDVMHKTANVLHKTEPLRVPSPSDAALARTSFNRQATGADQTLPSILTKPNHGEQRSQPYTAAGRATDPPAISTHRPNIGSMYNYGTVPYGNQNIWSTCGYPEMPSTSLGRGYSQGPFATSSNLAAAQAPQPYSGYMARLTDDLYQDPGNTTQPYFGGDQLIDMEIGWDTSRNFRPSSFNVAAPPSHGASASPAMHSQKEDQDGVIRAETTVQPAPKNPARLHISHLVNQDATSSSTGSRNLKRKAASVEDDHQTDEYLEPYTHEFAVNSQELTTSNGDISSNVANTDTVGAAEATRATEMQRYLLDIVDSNNIATPAMTQGSLDQGPPATKRARTEHASVPAPAISASAAAAPALGAEAPLTGDDNVTAPNAVNMVTSSPVQGQWARRIVNDRVTAARGRRAGRWLRRAATHALAGVAGATVLLAALIATVPDDVQKEAFAEY